MADTAVFNGGANEDSRVRKALEQIRSLLVPNETMESYAVQRRIFALRHRRLLVCATSGRFIGMTRGVFGGFKPQTVRWQDVKEVQIQIGIFGARLTLTAFTSPDLAVTGGTNVLTYAGLRKTQAESVYRICQEQDQAWREKRRVRELEELRAKSGGIQVGGAAGIMSAGSEDDAATRLQRAKEMLDKGLISDSEYESLKARIVSSL